MAFTIFSFLRSFFRGDAGHRPAQAASRNDTAPTAARAPARMQPAKPLRIVHKGPGRLVISGRMADVCAELERLAAMEAGGAQALLPSR